MKVVLTTDVKGLGRRGQVVSVADGYARNYILPKGLGAEPTRANLKRFEGEAQAVQRRVDKETAEAEASADRLDGFSLTVKAKAGEEGRLFGSVTPKDITQGIKNVLGLDIDKKHIELSEPVKSLGTYQVTVNLGPKLNREITVVVEPLE